MTVVTLTWAEDDLIDDVKNPSVELVLKAFNNLTPDNTEIHLGVGPKNWLLVAIDTTGTRYVVSLGTPLTGDRVVDSELIGRSDVYAMQPLKFYAQNGEGYSSYLRETIDKKEAERVLLYFYEHGKLPDDVTLL